MVGCLTKWILMDQQLNNVLLGVVHDLDKVLDQSKLKALSDNKINATEKLKFVFGMVKKTFWEKEKCWLPVFSPFLKMF